MTRQQIKLPSKSDFFNTPNLDRFTVGIDKMLDDFMRSNHISCGTSGGYPPYNVARVTAENGGITHEVTVALAGFTEDDIEIIVENNQLKISGKSEVLSDDVNSQVEYVYKGIAERNFTRIFKLADNVEVKSASLKNGILKIVLEQIVPEELQPKRIPINS